MDVDTAAAMRYWRVVRRFCLHAKSFTRGALFIETAPAERLDLTKISQRVYGTRHEALTIQAAAGLDHITDPLEQTMLVVPSPEKLLQLKREAGFETIPELRRGGEPIWKAY